MDDETVMVVCKVIPGFENISIQECNETLGILAENNIRGRIGFKMKINEISRLTELRAVSHYWVVVTELEDFFNSVETSEEVSVRLEQLPDKLCWKKAMQTWKVYKMNYRPKFFASTKATVYSKQQPKHVKEESKVNGDEESECNVKEESEINGDGESELKCNGEHSCANVEKQFNELKLEDLASIDPITAGEKLAFRVTAERTGKHTFSSMDTARHLGSGINEKFFWKVSMEKFDIEVVAAVLNDKLSIGIQLTTENQASRNITHFGPTTLKANISYCLLKYAQVTEGDVVCDPMCGSGSISIEGSLSCPSTFHIAGDNHPIGIQHCSNNIEAIEKEGDSHSLPASCVQWDVYQLPVRTASVDRIVTDLPFGKRIGNKGRNMFLYPVCLREMARICRPQGKAALLTSHKGALARAVKNSPLWKQLDVRKIYMGGLDAVVYLLGRTAEQFPINSTVTDSSMTIKPVTGSLGPDIPAGDNTSVS